MNTINSNIQVLRGVSVLLVLLFHLDITIFKFGYIGVDIFFLISGFLMPIILPKYDSYDFIIARVKRLFPGLSVVVFISLILGYFLLLPGEYSNLSISSVYAYLFSSQFYFIFNTGYFDQSAIYQPLLHTWSLGNEFIAYLLIFMVLVSGNRERIANISLAASCICGCYILYSLFFNSINYLDPVFRVFLFFSAFYVSYYRNRIKSSNKNLIYISIGSLLLGCVFFGDEILKKEWPNYVVFILPFIVLPLMLIKKNIIPFKFINLVLSKLGDWSYSIYLWHWPVIVYERIYLRNAHISYKEAVLLSFVSLVLGIFSYYYLERNNKLGIVCFILSTSLVVLILITNGASYRTPASLDNYASIEQMTDLQFYEKKQIINNIQVYTVVSGEATEGKTLIIGDSHSRHILPIYKSGYGGSIYRISLKLSAFKNHGETLASIFNKLKVDKVIFAYRFHSKELADIDIFTDYINTQNDSGVNFSILRDVPSYDGDPVACLFANESDLLFKSCGFDIQNGFLIDKVLNKNDNNWNKIEVRVKHKVELIDSHKKLCGERRCLTSINGFFIYRDSNHLNEKLPKSINNIIYNLIFSREIDL